jgi:hypothetical protein
VLGNTERRSVELEGLSNECVFWGGMCDGIFLAVSFAAAVGWKGSLLKLQLSRLGSKQDAHEDLILSRSHRNKEFVPLLVGPVGLLGWNTSYPQGKLGRERSFCKGEKGHFTGENTCKGAKVQPAHGAGEGLSNAGS